MLCETISVLAALRMASKYRRPMRIDRVELKRYLFKTFNLALCYRGFATSRSISDSIRCGQAAFYCCAYDVITDWRNFDPDLRVWYEKLLTNNVPAEIARLALDLYRDDRENQLERDGLSRGGIAAEFITRLVGNFDEVNSRFSVEYLGVLFQLVDDVLDIDEDIRDNATNCLLSSSRDDYLKMLIIFDFTTLLRVLPHAHILVLVAKKAQNQAQRLLNSGSLEEVSYIPSRPNNEIGQEEPGRIPEDVHV